MNVSCSGISKSPDGMGDGQRLDMTNNLTAFSFDKEVNMSWYFTRDMSHGYETVEEMIFSFKDTRIWINFQWGFFYFHLDYNFFSHFGIFPRSIFVNMVAPWGNSCSEWISHGDGSVMCCTLFQLRNTKKICLNSNSQNSNSRIQTEFESLFECCCCCVDFISLLLTVEEIVRK